MYHSCYIDGYCIRDHEDRRIAFFYTEEPPYTEKIVFAFNGCDYCDANPDCYKCQKLHDEALRGQPLPESSKKNPFIPPVLE